MARWKTPIPLTWTMGTTSLREWKNTGRSAVHKPMSLTGLYLGIPCGNDFVLKRRRPSKVPYYECVISELQLRRRLCPSSSDL